MIVFALAMAYSLARAQTGGAARYFYDANGRLTTVLSPTGEAAIYSYDPAGNFTAVTRRAANELSIIEFTPGAGGAGALVTIYGTGFLATPSANTVKFNGVTATVSAASNTHLDVNVPAGATTGPINVANTNGSINSSGNFFVSASAVEFSRPIAFGESAQFLFNVPPSGQVLTNVGMLTFNGVAGQRVSLVVEDLVCGVNSNPPPFAYAQISLISPSGATLTTVPMQNSTVVPLNPFAYLDPLALPSTGTYTILIDPNDSLYPQLCGGSLQSFGATARLYDVPPDITGPIAASGLPTPVSFSAPGQNAVLTFNGLNGQRIFLQGSQNETTQIGTDVKLYGPGTYPSGTPLVSRVLTSSFFVDTTTLAANGVYTILVDPQFNKTRTAVLTLYDVPPDVAGTLNLGAAAQTVTIPSVGQAANLTFSVPGNQQVTIHIRNLAIGPFSAPSTLTLSTQGGTQVFTQTINSNADYDIPRTLSPGTYVIRVDPSQEYTGSLSINLTTP